MTGDGARVGSEGLRWTIPGFSLMSKANLSLQEKAQALGRTYTITKSGGTRGAVRVRGSGLSGKQDEDRKVVK